MFSLTMVTFLYSLSFFLLFNHCYGDLQSKAIQKCEEFTDKYYVNFKDPAKKEPPGPGIHGGFNAPASEFTHMAVLGFGDENKPQWLCGGSLISENFVLTAAHCLFSREIGEVKIVRLGDLDLGSEFDDALPQDIKVKKLYRHPKYKLPEKYNDIALIELEKNVVISQYVKPACMRKESQIKEEFGLASGWGHLEYQGQAPEHLQAVYLEIHDDDYCKMFYQTKDRGLPRGIDKDSQFCAGGQRKDTCQGDSGGPFQVKPNELNKIYTVLGVTSFGKPCGITKAPGIYTRVSYYLPWIEAIVWPNPQ